MTGSVVIVGAGQAGVSAASKLRGGGYAGRIRLIGREPFDPYQRPPLSKAYMLGTLPAERMRLKPANFFEKNDIELSLGVSVRDIDIASRTVVSDDGELPYDDLILTPGADVIRFPEDRGGALAGVHYLRDRADADAMAAALKTARNILIVGGGYVGLEIAAAVSAPDRSVTVAEAADRILSRVACAETSDFFRALHGGRGVTILEKTGVARLDGDGRVRAAVLSDGTVLPVDLVVVGIGVRPSTQLAERCGLKIDNGIAVDCFGRTSAPGIWSAGDCCSFPYRERRVRLESVPNAIAQGETVALNILGEQVPYVAAPWFWSDQYDLKLQIAGLCDGYDRVVVRQGDGCGGGGGGANGADPGPRSHWYFRDGTLIAVDALNDPRSFVLARKLLAGGISPDPSLVAAPDADIKTLVQG